MVRMNITMPERVARKLSKFKNKSRFIAEAVEERIAVQEKEQMEQLLRESYKKAAKEDAILMKDWDALAGDGIE